MRSVRASQIARCPASQASARPSVFGLSSQVRTRPSLLERITPLFNATAEATEEAIVNALVAAETMTGVDGHTVYALPHDRLREVLRKYNRLIAR